MSFVDCLSDFGSDGSDGVFWGMTCGYPCPPNRNYVNEQGEKQIWQRFILEQDRLQVADEQRVCSIQLDVQSGDEFKYGN